LLALLVVLLVSAPYALAADEPVIWLTSVQGGREPEENPLFEQEVERLTGIKMKLVKPAGSEYTTKMTAMLATGEPLDIVYMNFGSFYALKDQDLFEPLTEWIKNSPVLSDPEIIAPSEWERITQEDGEIYGVFNKFEQGTLPIVRADWMEKLGFDPPETLDDYYELLKAFTFNDPDGNGKDDTYGLAIGYTLYDTVGLFGAYGLMRGFLKDVDGNLYAPYATEDAIPVYEWLAKLYAEGILEPNFVTNKSSNFRDLFMTDKAGMTFYWAAWVGLFNQQVKAENPDSPFKARGLVPPKGPGGRLLKAGSDGLMLIPRNSKNKEAAFKVMEFWHTHEGNVLSTLGILDHDYTMEGDKYVLTDVGKAHAMDHGAPQPKSLKWVNPLGELEGFEEAAAIVLEYGRPEMDTPYGSQWETIVRSEAAKIILGQISAAEGVVNMQQRFKEEGIYK
jgi:putative aldouronate transport system substrate-binding protein